MSWAEGNLIVDLEPLGCPRKLATKHLQYRIHTWTTPLLELELDLVSAVGVLDRCDRLRLQQNAYQISFPPISTRSSFPSSRLSSHGHFTHLTLGRGRESTASN